MTPVYRHFPWKLLLRSGCEGVAASTYGRHLMYKMMMTYDKNQGRYAKLAGHGFNMVAEAIKKDLPYEINCPALLICGTKDHAGYTLKYNREWNRHSGITIEWIKGAGHNSNTDEPKKINLIIEVFLVKEFQGLREGSSKEQYRVTGL